MRGIKLLLYSLGFLESTRVSLFSFSIRANVSLDGVDVKSLISSPDLFSPSGYKIKKTVQQIKALAATFGDEIFRNMVARAMDAEQETLARRFAARATA